MSKTRTTVEVVTHYTGTRSVQKAFAELLRQESAMKFYPEQLDCFGDTKYNQGEACGQAALNEGKGA